MLRRLAPLLLIATLASVGGCGFPTQDSSSKAVADQPASLITEPEGGRPILETVSVWLVGDETLKASPRRVQSPAEASSVLTELLSGPTDAEIARGLRSAIPSPDMVVDVATSAGRADVQLASDFLDIPAGDQVLALGQIVFTLTDLRGVGRVRFLIDDVPVLVPLPSGDSTEDSVSRDDFAALR
jgi:hypothetical protein